MNYGYNECLKCKNKSVFPQGLYCFKVERYIQKSETYLHCCSLFQAKNEQANTGDLKCDLCGKVETPPFAEGDECSCTGKFKPIT